MPDTVIKYLYALSHFILKASVWHGYYYGKRFFFLRDPDDLPIEIYEA